MIQHSTSPKWYTSKVVRAATVNSPIFPLYLRTKNMLTGKSNSPARLTAYGAYGVVMEPKLNSVNIPLLNQGVVCNCPCKRWRWIWRGGTTIARNAINNSLTDFIYTAKKLFADKYISKECLMISGNNAGGMLMGSILNMESDIAKLAILNGEYNVTLYTAQFYLFHCSAMLGSFRSFIRHT